MFDHFWYWFSVIVRSKTDAVATATVFADTNCNPSFFGGHNSTEDGTSNISRVALGVDWKSIVSLVIFLACVLYARFVLPVYRISLSISWAHSNFFFSDWRNIRWVAKIEIENICEVMIWICWKLTVLLQNYSLCRSGVAVPPAPVIMSWVRVRLGLRLGLG